MPMKMEMAFRWAWEAKMPDSETLSRKVERRDVANSGLLRGQALDFAIVPVQSLDSVIARAYAVDFAIVPVQSLDSVIARAYAVDFAIVPDQAVEAAIVRALATAPAAKVPAQVMQMGSIHEREFPYTQSAVRVTPPKSI